MCFSFCGIFGIFVYWYTHSGISQFEVSIGLSKLLSPLLLTEHKCSHSDKESHLEQHPSMPHGALQIGHSAALSHLHGCVWGIPGCSVLARAGAAGRLCVSMLCPTLFPPLAISSPVILSTGIFLGIACLWLQSDLYKCVHVGCQACGP